MRTVELADMIVEIIMHHEIASVSLLPIIDTFPHPPFLTDEHMGILIEATHQLRAYDAEMKSDFAKDMGGKR